MKIKTYISGKITGLHIEEAKAHFEHAEQVLSALGHEVVNPMKIIPVKHDPTWADYMIADIKALFTCTHIYMLHNWRDSKGARIEHAIAVETGLKILHQNEKPTLKPQTPQP
jgi:Domain of unknown function (DUF4406)